MKIALHRKLSLILASIVVALLVSATSVAQWRPTSGPSLGHVNGFYNYHDTLYAAMGEYGIGSIVRSADLGKSWQWLNYKLPLNFPVDAVIRDSTTLYLGTRNGLYTSTDEGATWNVSVAGATVHSFAIYNGSVYYCGLNGEFKFTSDHGITWTSAVSSNIPNNVALNKLFADSSDLYLGTNGAGVFRTQDSGKTWAQIATNIPQSEAYIVSISKVDTLLFISTIRNLYRSTDNGITWNVCSSGLPSENGTSALANNGDLLLAGVVGYGLYLSSDCGTTWTKSTQHSTLLIPSAFAIVEGMIIEGCLGIYRSTDSARTWEPSSIGVASTSITSLVPTNSGILCGDLDADFGLLWRTTDMGTDWDTSATGLSTIGVNALARSGNNILCATDGSGIFYSSDDGHSWNQASGLSSEYILSLASIGNNVIAGANGFPQSLFRSTDAGVTWAPLADQVPSGIIGSVIVDGTDFLLSVNGSGLFRSMDSGRTWSSIAGPSVTNPIIVNACMGSCFANDGGTNVFRSTDHGTFWQPISSGLQGRRTLVITAAGSLLYAGTDLGIFYSADSGLHWLKDTSDIENYSVTTLLAANGVLYAGTIGGGVWKLPLNASDVEEQNLVLSSLNVWPNPSKGSTIVSYSLKSANSVLLRLIDESGHIIQSWERGLEVAGRHAFNLEFGSEPKGNYILQLFSGSESIAINVAIQ